jgi:hypothetical protein
MVRPPVRWIIPLTATAAALLAATPAARAQYSWDLDGPGNWSAAANRAPARGPPNAPGATAPFGEVGFSTKTVTAVPAVTVGAINLNPNSYTIALAVQRGSADGR